jgi:DNA-binding Lrp family transcriptional regulator
MSAVWEHSTQTLGARLVLLAIADYAHDDGTGAWPSVATLAKKVLMSPRNVQYALRKLEESGEIVREGLHESGATIWRITLPMGANIAPPANIAPGRNPFTGGVQKTTKGGAKSAPKPLRTTIEPSSPSPAKKKTPFPHDWMPSEALREYAVSWGIPPADIDEVAKEFREFWIDEKVPRNWDLTFMNRVRTVAPQYKARARGGRNGKASELTYYTNITAPDPEDVRRAALEKKALDHWHQLRTDPSLTSDERQAKQKAYRESLA